MTRRQKHKGMKRPRSWHHRGRGPDQGFRAVFRGGLAAAYRLAGHRDRQLKADRKAARREAAS